MKDLLLPRTDAGVAAQLAVFTVAAVTALAAVRKRREWLVLVSGLTLFGLGLFGVRAIH